MKRLRQAFSALAIASACTLAACGKDRGPAAPKAGELTLNLTTPYADDGAILVAISGPQIGTVRAASSALAVHSRAVSGGVKVAVFGDIASGALLRIAVPDVSQPSKYSATVVEVSDRANALRSQSPGYKTRIQ
ncbi:MAG: hypothetical protein H7Z74_09755 [Anaerolineae bacterium]|nr:hypothetical protein [Gemmatimonadaceae bacterium]